MDFYWATRRYVRFEVFTAVVLKSSVFWDIKVVQFVKIEPTIPSNMSPLYSADYAALYPRR
jgi:hypothetical protein